jgi:hypothetical protein
MMSHGAAGVSSYKAKEIKMSSKLETEVFQAAMAQPASEEIRAQDLFNFRCDRALP